jgi:hypothetical protein
MNTSKDVEVLELGFNYALYAMTLAGAAGAFQNPVSDPYRQKIIALADESTENLRRTIIRCGLSIGGVRSASDLGSFKNIMEYLQTKANPLGQELTDEIVAKMGNRQEKIFLFSAKFSQAIGAKRFGADYPLNISQMIKMGGEIGFDEASVRKWAALPTESTFSEIRNELEGIVSTSSKSTQVVISGGIIGVLNTGEMSHIENINTNISVIDHAKNSEVAQALKEITEAIIHSQELPQQERSELLEQIQEVSKQATLPVEARSSKGVLKAVLAGIAGTVSTVGGIAEIWSTWGGTILKFFGL